MNKRFLTVTFALLAAMAVSSGAQIMRSSSVVEFRYVPGQDVYSPGGSFQMVFEVEVKDGWHTQSDKPDMEGLVATRLSMDSKSSITFGRAGYPAPVMEKFSFSKDPLPTFKGKFFISMAGAVPVGIAPGDYNVMARLQVQACDESSCIAPAFLEADIPIKVAPQGTAVNYINQDIYKLAAGFMAGGGAPEPGLGMGDIGGYIRSKGMFLTLLLIFFGGLALNLTPCVYPLIPITVSFFGGTGEKSKVRLAGKAAFYFLGMTTMYSSLGVVAALTGSLFGAMLQSPVVALFLVAAMVALSLSMFGMYDIRIPDFLNQVGGENREGFIGAFLMGLTAGIIAAPCIGPFVLGLLTFVGEQGDPALGFLMFFTLAAGLGAPYVALAMFSGGLSMLPRSGMWMVWVKKVFGFVLLGMAIYFMQPLIPKAAYAPIIAVFMVTSGIYLGFFSRVTGASGKFVAAQSLVGLAVAGMGVFVWVSASAPSGPSIKWENATLHSLAKAKADKKAVVMDFTADWCIPCKELERYTFSDGRVVELSDKLRALKVDLTLTGNLEAKELKNKYEVQGVPTVVFLDSGGREITDLRFVGFVDADSFLERLVKLLGT
ncbi:MAG: thioredoxin family protein [Nitrospinota bacterium]|nr:thioredoxin family protein [Nitrospinota bacterium]